MLNLAAMRWRLGVPCLLGEPGEWAGLGLGVWGSCGWWWWPWRSGEVTGQTGDLFLEGKPGGVDTMERVLGVAARGFSVGKVLLSCMDGVGMGSSPGEGCLKLVLAPVS